MVALPGRRELSAEVAPSRPRRRSLAPYLYVAPMLALIGLFTYWPLVSTFGLAFERWNLNPDMPMRFVGTENFGQLFASQLFRDAALNTVAYLLAALPLKVLLPIPIAIAMWSLGRSGLIYRSVLFLPTLLSFVVVSIAFVFFLNPLGGAVTAALAALGLCASPRRRRAIRPRRADSRQRRGWRPWSRASLARPSAL